MGCGGSCCQWRWRSRKGPYHAPAILCSWHRHMRYTMIPRVAATNIDEFLLLVKQNHHIPRKKSVGAAMYISNYNDNIADVLSKLQ
uniref:Uncharacterized protein n=1 Tax=Arundo donax TaxID=35708 RepID=A0A0A9B1P6_ARUDO